MPDFLIIPHLGHILLIGPRGLAVVVAPLITTNKWTPSAMRNVIYTTKVTHTQVDDDIIHTLHSTCHKIRTHERTFAGLNALDPCMIEVCVAGISAVLEPSTAASATTAFAGFLDSAALGTPFGAGQGCTRCRGRFCGNDRGL